VAERMRTSLGQPVVIENVTGAGGSIGAGRVARAVPDSPRAATSARRSISYATPRDGNSTWSWRGR
jgi:tripartite-type tricarboxylate transporter receptor subunit TctC